jgi:hypothetical protein
MRSAANEVEIRAARGRGTNLGLDSIRARWQVPWVFNGRAGGVESAIGLEGGLGRGRQRCGGRGEAA